MSLNKEFLSRETNITAKVICDSINEKGVRLTTFEIEYPRFIHSELMTHRNLSKNSSSSRAIPILKMIDQIIENGATPIYWGKSKSGMQSEVELDVHNKQYSKDAWDIAKEEAITSVECLCDYGLHKQTANRLLEPFQMMKVVVTGTDWDNFFNLRIHPDAQPEILMLAYKMIKAMDESTPYQLKVGEWHLPYVKRGVGISSDGEKLDWFNGLYIGEYPREGMPDWLSLEDAIKISAASCASVSYRTEGMTLEKAEKIFDMLIKAEVVHSSPFEHLATPISAMSSSWYESNREWADYSEGSVNIPEIPSTWEGGITHINRQGQLCSGNLRGWIQYRHLLPNNTCWEFDFEERMKMFK